MSSAEKIKKLFAKSGLTVNSKVDDRIISNALTALEKSEKTKSVSAEQNIWRIIMKSGISKLAATTVIGIGVIIGIGYLEDSSEFNQAGWGLMLESRKKMYWGHISKKINPPVLDDAIEEWK